MAFIPAADTARVSMHFTQDGQKVENQFYVQNVTGWDASSLSALGLAVKNWWTAGQQANSPSTLTLVEVVCKDMTTETGTEIVFTTGLPVSGTNSGTALPNSITAAIKLLTAMGGRSFRGRQYILGILQGHLNSDQNSFTTTATALWLTNYNALRTAINSSYTPGLVIASFFSGVDSSHHPIPRSAAVLTPVTGFGFADNLVDNQRRRLPGRGR